MSGRIILVGAGGTGLSALALLFHRLNIPKIIAVDSHESEITKKLQTTGIEVIIGHGHIQAQPTDIVIYSDAAMESPEVLQAKKHIPTMHKRAFPPLSYFQFLGEISKYMMTIAVAGTHGKSTTTALLATTLHDLAPHFGLGIVGAPVNARGHTNIRIGEDHIDDLTTIIRHILFPQGQHIAPLMKQLLFVVEADEYNQHFLHLDSDYGIITNIELDHVDVYGSFENYCASFGTFAQKVKKGIYLLDELAEQDLLLTTTAPLHRVTQQDFAFTHLLGTHNHANASLAAAVAHDILPAEKHSKVKTSLENFSGLRRRGELLGENTHGVSIISDYGHHPSEIKSTLAALREKYPDESIACIFQPHQARRVLEFRDAFQEALASCEQTIIYDIYAAREDIQLLKKGVLATADAAKQKLFQDITSVTDLGTTFADVCDASYITHSSAIIETIETITSGVIIIFTAGNLDRDMRKGLQLQTQ